MMTSEIMTELNGLLQMENSENVTDNRKDISTIPLVNTSIDESRIISNRPLREGDPVILFAKLGQLTFVPYLRMGVITNMKIGNFHHQDIIERHYGCKVHDRKTRRWVAVLRPTPHLLTDSLTHRTQIIYQADIYTLLMLLDAKSGDTIIESGTGSGSLTPHLALAVGLSGRIHTFEFHESRYREAKVQFEQYRLDSIITTHRRDVCTSGFDLEIPTDSNVKDRKGDCVESCDKAQTSNNSYSGMPYACAAFLDLPQPWKALEHIHRSLKPCGKVVTFSPCIEQIQRTERWLIGHGFREVRVFESLSKPWCTTNRNGGYEKTKFLDEENEAHNKKKRRRNVTQTAPSSTSADGLEINGISAEQKQENCSELQELVNDSEMPSYNNPSEDLFLQYEQHQYPMKGHTSYLLAAVAPLQFSSS